MQQNLMELAGQADKPAAQAPAATSAVQQVSQQPAAQIQQPMASVAPGASAIAPAVAAQLLQNPQVMCCHSLQLATRDAAGAVALPRSLECEWQACALADSGGFNSCPRGQCRLGGAKHLSWSRYPCLCFRPLLVQVWSICQSQLMATMTGAMPPIAI